MVCYSYCWLGCCSRQSRAYYYYNTIFSNTNSNSEELFNVWYPALVPHSGGCSPVWTGGPGLGRLFCWGYLHPGNKRQIPHSDKHCLQFQQFWLGSKLLRHFISAFFCHRIIDADSLSEGPQGGPDSELRGQWPLLAPQNHPWSHSWPRLGILLFKGTICKKYVKNSKLS